MISRKYIKIVKYLFENKYQIDYELNPKKNIICRACYANDLDIVKLLVTNGFDFNVCYDSDIGGKNSLLLIKDEQILMYLIKKNNLRLSNEIFYHAIQNNWVSIITYYFESDSIEWETLSYAWVLKNLLLNKHFDFIKIVLQKSNQIFYSNLINSLKLYGLNPCEFNIYTYDDNNYNYNSDNIIKNNDMVDVSNTNNQYEQNKINIVNNENNENNNTHDKTD